MKFLIVLVAALVGANAQFTCGQCDAGDRLLRTGCRLFCYIDVYNTGTLSKNDLVTRFNEWNGGNSVSKETFVIQIMKVSKYCASEAGGLFDLFASVGGSDPTLIERTDINTVWEVFQLISGSSIIDKDTWLVLNDLLYDIVADPECTTGY